jgi:galactokinase
MTLQDSVVQAYQDQFGVAPEYVIRAPGRVNIIGDHTDYNDGFVMPMTINYAVWIACGRRDDTRVVMRSLNFDDLIDFDLTAFEKASTSPAEYVKGVAFALQERGHELGGMQGIIAGDVPIGAGLSSSAALEMAVARVFATLNDIPWDVREMAKVGQQAENAWVGVSSGIMDQLISTAGEAGSALLIDCRSLALTPATLPQGAQIVVLDTNTRRGLVGSKYNERFAQCAAAAQFFGVGKLRDVTLDAFNARVDELGPIIAKRARHVITESIRTVSAQQALMRDDVQAVGQLMNESHVSMRDDFENSTEQVDAMVSAAQAHSACYGARMTGGGFGGSAVALINAEDLDGFVIQVSTAYQAKTGITPNLIPVEATAGAKVIQ